NGATDDSADRLAEAFPAATILRNAENLGFAVGCNQAIAASSSEYVLLLNHDVRLQPDYIATLVVALEADPAAGWAAGKLLRPDQAGETAVIDSAGEVIKRNRRVINRGEEEPDVGQYDDPCEIFGVSAAAAMYRRQMLEQVAPEGHVFDPDFFAYIEDSDLNWRCRNAGWRCWYVPAAVGWHGRGHATTKALKIRRHAYANRYLMIAKNDTAANFLRDLPEIALYETYRLLKCLFVERELLAGYCLALRLLPRALARRRTIQGMRRASPQDLRCWFATDDYVKRVLGLRRA
ncbi:MAG: glycosyltransferase family 2 protein, partial [Cyanobacteria bacterium REEB65]|nr:glycosyltransferase family 2 protein [Cyanobacteria bacterium REEB65]